MAHYKVSAYVSTQRLRDNTYSSTQSCFVLDPPASHCEGANSIAEQCVWKLWCKTVTTLLQTLPSFHKQIINPIMLCILSHTVWGIENVPVRRRSNTDTGVSQRYAHTHTHIRLWTIHTYWLAHCRTPLLHKKKSCLFGCRFWLPLCWFFSVLRWPNESGNNEHPGILRLEQPRHDAFVHPCRHRTAQTRKYSLQNVPINFTSVRVCMCRQAYLWHFNWLYLKKVKSTTSLSVIRHHAFLSLR